MRRAKIGHQEKKVRIETRNTKVTDLPRASPIFFSHYGPNFLPNGSLYPKEQPLKWDPVNSENTYLS